MRDEQPSRRQATDEANLVALVLASHLLAPAKLCWQTLSRAAPQARQPGVPGEAHNQASSGASAGAASLKLLLPTFSKAVIVGHPGRGYG